MEPALAGQVYRKRSPWPGSPGRDPPPTLSSSFISISVWPLLRSLHVPVSTTPHYPRLAQGNRLPDIWVWPQLALQSLASPCHSLGLNFPICHGEAGTNQRFLKAFPALTWYSLELEETVFTLYSHLSLLPPGLWWLHQRHYSYRHPCPSPWYCILHSLLSSLILLDPSASVDPTDHSLLLKNNQLEKRKKFFIKNKKNQLYSDACQLFYNKTRGRESINFLFYRILNLW